MNFKERKKTDYRDREGGEREGERNLNRKIYIYFYRCVLRHRGTQKFVKGALAFDWKIAMPERHVNTYYSKGLVKSDSKASPSVVQTP